MAHHCHNSLTEVMMGAEGDTMAVGEEKDPSDLPLRHPPCSACRRDLLFVLSLGSLVPGEQNLSVKLKPGTNLGWRNGGGEGCGVTEPSALGKDQDLALPPS